MKIPSLFPDKSQTAADPEKQIQRRNILSFAVFIAFNTAAFASWRWLYHSPLEAPGATAGTRRPLRKALNKTELFFRRVFSPKHLVKTYPKSMAAKVVRQNGNEGLSRPFQPENWKLQVNRASGAPLQVSLEEIRALPKTEIIFDFKCVEGWDQISHWGGVTLSDFMQHYGLKKETTMEYVGMTTPDQEYYIGIDMPSALHPQTLLCYEMNGKLLPWKHGYPLRLIIPVKYGIKNLKRIGTMTFSNQRPPDFWAERGYDYYSGL